MSRPRALDLFCGAGGVSVGLHRAGFDVVGVDLNPKVARSWMRGMQGQGAFICASALDVPLSGFDFIWASPPCQRFSSSTHKANRDNHPDLVDPIRQRLRSSGSAWVIENVPGAPLLQGFMLCGGAFGLKTYRHRLFEPSFAVLAPPCPGHPETVPRAGRGASRGGYISVAGNVADIEAARRAMDIDWMSRGELVQSIPPAYAEWIGRRAIEYIGGPV